MSTRCSIHFEQYGQTAAIVYRHGDGYPEAVLPDLDKFFAAVEEQTPKDTRFDDASHLAAKFVVWQAGQTEWLPPAPLRFTGVGILMGDPGDIEYRYHVVCSTGGEGPQVTHEEA